MAVHTQVINMFQEFNKLYIDDMYHPAVSYQNRELAESLKYAGYIQKALFPTRETMQQLFPSYFVFLRPRDIVSGDFFWVARCKEETILIVADGTGHGVPGAFMSILGITLLNQVIGQGAYRSAGGLLNQLREAVMKALGQQGREKELKDGIEMAICIFRDNSPTLQFAGAFSPLYIVRNKQLLEYRGDKMPVGVAADEELPFTTHTIGLFPNDMIYLFTDGFVDQFGGPEGKKYKYQPFRSLLKKLHELPMPDQKEGLSVEFDKWRNGLPQLDDVLVLGIRYTAQSTLNSLNK